MYLTFNWGVFSEFTQPSHSIFKKYKHNYAKVKRSKEHNDFTDIEKNVVKGK